MSLFTLKDLWSIDCIEGGSTFSHKSVCIGNIDTDAQGEEKVVLGSYSGILRLIGTKLVKDASAAGSEDTEPSIRKGNLLAELNLGFPILQVETGYFVGGSNKLHLAILHPQKLGVYAVTKVSGQVEHGSQYKVTLLYEHQLKRLSFNMCVGAFGQSRTGILEKTPTKRDLMCVQALDGTLSFFEQEVFSFSRYLPNFLIPGPITFNPYTNSFLTVNSSWDLQSFRYTSLAMAKDEASRQTEETTVGKKLTPDWFCSIGEETVGDIQILLCPNDECRIVVVTFRNFICLSGIGELLFSKRLDYPVSAFTAFLNSSNECVTVAASGNDAGALYVYVGTVLKWGAKLPFVPAFLGRVPIQNVPGTGGILLLSTEGKLSVNVLGTEPSLFVAPPVQSRDLDYEAAEKELNSLRKIIAEAGEQNIVSTKDAVVEVKVEFEGQKTKWAESNGLEVIALIATVKVMCHVRVNDVRVTIHTPKPIICSQDSVYIGDIVGRHSYTMEFHTENEAIPSDLQCEVNILYLSESGSPHYIQKTGIKIPLFIIMKPEDKLDKDGEAKLTFTLDKPVLNLITLYNDFDWNSEASPAGLTFRLCGGERVTILASTKVSTATTSRYRIQSDSIAAIHLIFQDLLNRLQRKFGREPKSFEVSLPDAEIPLLNEYFQELDAHILRRRRDLQIKEDLAGRAAQLRAIQRRLLLRFRDKNAIPLTQLETLLDGSIEQIVDGLNFMEENELEMQKSECRVSGGTRLILELCLLQGGRSVDELTTLSSALCPHVSDFIEERGWEESVYSALSFIKTQVVSVPTFEQLDSSKLKKIIKTTLEKIRKSTKPIQAPQVSVPVSNEPEKLVGNEITERMASARARTARKRNPVLEPIQEPVDGDHDRHTPSPNNEIKPSRNESLIETIVENEMKSSHANHSQNLEAELHNSVANGHLLVVNNTEEDDEEADPFW